MLPTLIACGGGAPASDQAPAATTPIPPLAPLAGQPLIVLPVRYFNPADTLGWGAQAGQAASYLRELDNAIAVALTERGVTSSWVLADRLIASARRNPIAMPDPTQIPADRMRGRLVPGNVVGDPLASQLRALTAIGNARHALLPVELRFEHVAGGVRPVLRIVLVDTRTSMIRLSRDVVGDPHASFSPMILTNMAERFADLFATR